MDQKIVASGRVVRDPECRRTSNNRWLTRVTVAADEVSRNGERIDPEKNKWQVAVFWGKEAEEVAQSIKKGALVRISGEEVSRQYEGNDGKMKETTELTAATVERLEPHMQVTGNLVRDPELKAVGRQNSPMLRISVAADEVKREGELLDPSQNKFHTAIFWGEQAVQYAKGLNKGARVELEGDLVTREYEKDGIKKTAFEIHRGSLKVLDRGKGMPLPAGPSPERSGGGRAAGKDAGDIPY
jgi:single-strand DNA-binding protein